MEVMCSFETYLDFYQTSRHDIPEDYTLHGHHCENLKCNIFYVILQYLLHTLLIDLMKCMYNF
jgi:hypothetical protein